MAMLPISKNQNRKNMCFNEICDRPKFLKGDVILERVCKSGPAASPNVTLAESAAD